MSVASDHEAVHAQLGAYFDGELTADDEGVVLEHLADCERCQTALDDLMGMHVALGRATPPAALGEAKPSATPPLARSDAAPTDARVGADVIPLAPRRARRGWAMAGVALAAAAAVVVVVWAPRRKPRTESESQPALADTRPVEVRFTAHDFSLHRPYRVDRGGPSATPLPLSFLSALERRGDRAALIAALVWSGDRARATSIVEGMAADATVLADRAALAVLRGEPEAALDAADRALLIDPSLAAARWNRALALRHLSLPLAAAIELEGLAAGGEPGWATEAAERARALRDPVEARRAARVDASARRRAAIAGGPPLTAADVELAPTPARHYFHDALRVAATVAEVDALAPLAAALDRQSGGTESTRELGRVRGLDLTRRAAFAPRYREVAAGKLSVADVEQFLSKLAAAGPALDDVRLGAIILGRRLREHLANVERIAASSDHPWFLLLAVHERAAAGRPHADDGALAERLCSNPAWALRCATIDYYRAFALVSLGRLADAERAARRRLDLLAVGSTGSEEQVALAFLSEIQRVRGRLGLSAATASEALAYVSGDDCGPRQNGAVDLAELARRRGNVARSRALLAHPEACPSAVDQLAFIVVVDLSRDTGDAADRALAERWIAAARAAGVQAAHVDIADARLHIADQGDRARATLTRVLAEPPADAMSRALAEWGWRTLIADDGSRADWKSAFDHVLGAAGQQGPTTCAIALAADDAIFTAAWRDAVGDVGGAQWRQPAPWPPLPATALRGCSTTAVIALEPLHGRPLPWALGAWAWSTGGSRAPASSPSPERLVVAATSPPRDLLDLPNLAPVAIPPGSRGLVGADATPSRVAAAMRTATYVEIHAHGLVDLDTDDGGFIALSPDPDGDWRLSASDLHGVELKGAPVVVLAACRVAEAAPDRLRRWSLPDAFLAAGARAVIAADVAVPDDLIRGFVDDVRSRLDRGEAPAVAAAAARAALIARDPKSASWVDRLMVFE